ncbi:Gfo/Idh/MocA family protein [Arthrobacter sp. Marseille-P9274]|uniref:Gfo/Idh/MocA family protein n=1 Tax=Arthrobacter sp. Marseille-P9274 TaxID=2866572 RepID=UPI0021C66CD8|nr:Gfo/Idh/MocA family oxidoreductase [Arthrobacter sp. Marseille-P9274]
MTIRTGVVGAGIMGADHAENLARNIGGSTLACVADIDGERAKAAASALGARAVTDPLELIHDDGVDAVVIASHDSTHPELVQACLDAGKPVLCEKPLASTAHEARRIVEAERAVRDERGVSPVSVGFMRRFDPGHVELRQALAEGGLGRPLLLHGISRNVSAAPGATSESAVTNSAIHELDAFPWLLDSPIAEVSWVPGVLASSEAAPGLQDPAFMMIRLRSGVLATLELFLNAGHGYSTQCEVVGERGTARVVEPAAAAYNLERKNYVAYPADWRPRFAEAYRRELQAWVRHLLEGTPSSLAKAEDGLRATLAADAMVRSMHDGGAFTPVAAA